MRNAVKILNFSKKLLLVFQIFYAQLYYTKICQNNNSLIQKYCKNYIEDSNCEIDGEYIYQLDGEYLDFQICFESNLSQISINNLHFKNWSDQRIRGIVFLQAGNINVYDSLFNFDGFTQTYINITSFNQDINIKNSNITNPNANIIQSYYGSIILNQSYIEGSVVFLFAQNHINLTDNSVIISQENKCKGNCRCESTYACKIQDPKLYTYPQWIKFYDQFQKKFNYTEALLSIYMTQTFELYDQFYEYFSVTLISNNATYLNGQQNFIIGGNIGLYSPLVQIQQSDGVSATGLGCMKNRGFGCGFSGVSSWFCGGSGGSHGGQGSIGQETSVSPNLICQQIQSRGIYGTADYPVFEGSGGGGLQDDSQGSGGGFIFIQAYHKLIVDGFIEADGTPPKIQSAYSNGSGSGGSIQIYAQYLTRLSNIKFENDGQNYNLESYKLQTKQKKWYGHREDQSVQMGDINDFKKLYKMQKYNKYIQSHTLADQIKLGCITANGGIGVIGGGGGGGRIRIFLTYSMEEVMLQGFSSDFKQVIIKTDPGYSPILDQYQTNLGQGSIVSTPCPPGYYAEDGIYFCKLCKPGTYKSQISVGPCQPCNDIPENMVAVQTISLDYNCQLVCKDNKAWEYYLPNSNGYFVCLTQWEYFYINIYGSNGLMIIIIMIVICLIMLFRKVVKERRSMIRQQKEQLLEKHIKQNQEIDNMINQDNQQNAIEEFIVDDLPYHNKRIYLQGENSYSLPWYLQGQTELDENINPSVYIDLCKQFNEIASYNLIKKVLLICLKYGYLPFYYMISVHYKKQKFQKLKELIDQRQSELIINQQVKIKLSSSPDYTLSYLDIMDYNKDILLWNYQMKYPITLVLSGNGTFLFPLRFNTKDPLSKSLLITLSYCKQEEQFEEENNRGSYKKKLGKFIRKFNDIAKQIDYLQSEKTFIKQFINLLELIEEANQQLFRNLDIQAQMCVHKNLKKNHNFYEKNQVIFMNINKPQLKQDQIKLLKQIQQGIFKNYEIKFSLNFIQIDKQQDYYNDDYNESEYKQSDYYYQEKDQTINQYLDEDQEQSYYDFQKQESLKSQQNQQDEALLDSECKEKYQNKNKKFKINIKSIGQYILMGLVYFKRMVETLISLIICYRTSSIRTNVLIGIMLIVMLFDFTLILFQLVSYFVESKFLSYEIFSLVLIYPFSFLIAPLLNIAWLCRNKYIFGKYFLMFSFGAILTHFINTLFAIDDILKHKEQTKILFSFFKIFAFFTTIFANIVGTIFITRNHEDDEDLD